jgi:hypothetical protein
MLLPALTMTGPAQQAEASRISADAAMLTAKNAGNRAVASMRVQWVEKLREILYTLREVNVQCAPVPSTKRSESNQCCHLEFYKGSPN